VELEKETRDELEKVGEDLSPEKLRELFFKVRADFRFKRLAEDRLIQAQIDQKNAEASYKESNANWTNAITRCSGEQLDAFDKLMGSPWGPLFNVIQTEKKEARHE